MTKRSWVLGALLPVGEPCLDCSSIWAPLVLKERVFVPCCFSSSPAKRTHGNKRGDGWREGHRHIEGAKWEVSKENSCKKITSVKKGERNCQGKTETGEDLTCGET